MMSTPKFLALAAASAGGMLPFALPSVTMTSMSAVPERECGKTLSRTYSMASPVCVSSRCHCMSSTAASTLLSASPSEIGTSTVGGTFELNCTIETWVLTSLLPNGNSAATFFRYSRDWSKPIRPTLPELSNRKTRSRGIFGAQPGVGNGQLFAGRRPPLLLQSFSQQ